MVVTKLPQREKIAKKPTTISATVTQNATIYAANIHPATFLYTFSPSSSFLGISAPAPPANTVAFLTTSSVPSPHTSTGSNAKPAFRGEQEAGTSGVPAGPPVRAAWQ